MSARKAKPPKPPRPAPQDGAELAVAMVRAFRTGSPAEVQNLAARAPASTGRTVTTFLATVAAGLLADVPDERLEAAVTAAFLRGMHRRPGPPGESG